MKSTMVVLLMFLGLNTVAADQTDIDKRIKNLENLIGLSDNQIGLIRDILKSEQVQAIKDRETFKKDPAALIKAARERRRTTNDKIANILTSDQKKAFQNFIFSGFIETPTLLLVERLSLTLDQTDSVKTIMEISQQNMEQIKSEYPNNRRLRFEEMRKNMQETNNKIKDILSDEQKNIYQKLIAERQQNQRSRMMGRRGGRGRRR